MKPWIITLTYIHYGAEPPNREELERRVGFEIDPQDLQAVRGRVVPADVSIAPVAAPKPKPKPNPEPEPKPKTESESARKRRPTQQFDVEDFPSVDAYIKAHEGLPESDQSVNYQVIRFLRDGKMVTAAELTKALQLKESTGWTVIGRLRKKGILDDVYTGSVRYVALKAK